MTPHGRERYYLAPIQLLIAEFPVASLDGNGASKIGRGADIVEVPLLDCWTGGFGDYLAGRVEQAVEADVEIVSAVEDIVGEPVLWVEDIAVEVCDVDAVRCEGWRLAGRWKRFFDVRMDWAFLLGLTVNVTTSGRRLMYDAM